jgi:MYXO-CTERM domain-containing protein
MSTRRLVASIALVAACAAEPSGPARRTDEIVNGTVDNGDPATVFLWLGGGSCSGTLISPHVILTARHCLEGTSASSISVFFGTSADGEGTWIDAVDAIYHPAGDIGMVAMAEVGPAAPIPPNARDLSAFVGQPVRIVGFGVTSENGSDSGLKRQGTTELDSVDGDIMYTGFVDESWTCYGDSGGPNFMTIEGVEYVVGATSFGTTICGQPADGAVRTDTYHEWIMEFVAEHDPATCAGDGACASSCPAPDPDCPCAGDGFCTASCADVASDPDCAGCGAGDKCRADCPDLDTDCCAADGSCNEACGDADADCEGPVDPGDPADPSDPADPDAPGSLTGGCAAGGRPGPAWLAAAALALALARRRRRQV